MFTQLLRIIQSALAAAFGVQSAKNRERDFKEGHIGLFVIAGVIFTVIFVTAVLGVVTYVTR